MSSISSRERPAVSGWRTWSAIAVLRCTTGFPYIEKVDTWHHERINDSEDNIGLQGQSLAISKRPKDSDHYLVANAIKRDGAITTSSASHVRSEDEKASRLRYHHNHEVPDPTSWSAHDTQMIVEKWRELTSYQS